MTQRSATDQGQFLTVLSRDKALQRFLAALSPTAGPAVIVELDQAQNMVLAEDILSPVDVPAFDRSNVDGFAVRSADTSGALEEHPVRLRLNDEILATGMAPTQMVRPGTATPIATGAMLPRGADAVVMIEQTETIQLDGAAGIEVRRAVAPGESLTFAGTDITRGETVAWRGTLLTAREIGVLAAIGLNIVPVISRPRVAILSTGNEVIPPGEPLPLGCIYDSNAAILSASVRELGGEPVVLGVFQDSIAELAGAVRQGLETCDLVVLSGGTSKGAGDLSYEVVREFTDPGIVVHGVALKPGKPLCLAVTRQKGVVILPGFPTSAVFTFHEFVAPIIRILAGRERPATSFGAQQDGVSTQKDGIRAVPDVRQRTRRSLQALLPMSVNSERGRTEYLLVNLVPQEQGWSAYPMGKGSGSVTTFSRADGFITIPASTEILPAGSEVEVTLIDDRIVPADLTIIGSHCIGLDLLIGRLQEQGITTKVMHVGSLGGLAAAERDECDLAPLHLFDPETESYNIPFLREGLVLIPGYRRMQAFLYRRGDERFQGRTLAEALSTAVSIPECVMINRNSGSGTRILIDQLLQAHLAPGCPLPPGYAVQPRSHQAVAAAIVQGRADWGVAIDTVARGLDLETIPITAECYDFAVPADRLKREPVQAFRKLLDDAALRECLAARGLRRDLPPSG